MRSPDGKENRHPQEKEAANIFEGLILEEPKDEMDSSKSALSVSNGSKAKNMAISKLVYAMNFIHDEVLFSSVSFVQDL